LPAASALTAIHGESDDAAVRIIQLSGEHARFEGVDDPSAPAPYEPLTVVP